MGHLGHVSFGMLGTSLGHLGTLGHLGRSRPFGSLGTGSLETLGRLGDGWVTCWATWNTGSLRWRHVGGCQNSGPFMDP